MASEVKFQKRQQGHNKEYSFVPPSRNQETYCILEYNLLQSIGPDQSLSEDKWIVWHSLSAASSGRENLWNQLVENIWVGQCTVANSWVWPYSSSGSDHFVVDIGDGGGQGSDQTFCHFQFPRNFLLVLCLQSEPGPRASVSKCVFISTITSIIRDKVTIATFKPT